MDARPTRGHEQVAQYDAPRWDAGPSARPPFERTGGFLALGVVLVIAAAALGFLLGWGSRDTGSATTPSAGGTGASQASASSDATMALQAMLPPSIYRDCSPRTATAGATASLSCSSPSGGADELLVTQYADNSTMSSDFADKYASRYPDGTCGSFAGGTDPKGKGMRSTWGPGDKNPLACYVNDSGAAALLWEYPDRAVQVIGVRKDADSKALFMWWNGGKSQLNG